VVDIGARQVEIVQLVPIYDSERILLADGGDIAAFLSAFPRHALMDHYVDRLSKLSMPKTVQATAAALGS